MASHDLRAGSTRHGCLCSIITWTSSTTNMGALPTSCSPLPYHGTLTGHTPSHTTFFHFLNPFKGHLPPSRFWLHFRNVSRLYIAASLFRPSSTPPQAGCRHCNPSNVALLSTVSSLPSVWWRREHACPGRQTCPYPDG
jgi:hypothetical protein